MSDCVVIVNPHAGPDLDVATLTDDLGFLGRPVVRLTTRAGEATEIARAAAESDADMVVVVGGDGTLHEVVNGLGPNFDRCRLGIVPAGTGNDAARSLGIPLEVEAALRRLRLGGDTWVDIIQIDRGGGRSFALNAVTGGFGGVVSGAMTDELKAWWGPLAYARAATGAAAAPPVFDVRLSLDDGGPEALRVMSLVIGNGARAARGVYVAPGADMTDGRLSIHAVLESGLSELVAMAAAVAGGQVPEHERYRTWSCELARVQCEEGLPVSVDGELTEDRDVEYRVLPAALRVVGARPAEP